MTGNRTPGDRRRKRPIQSTIITSNPDIPPPALRCPACDRPLSYLRTVLGGIKPLERWDYFECLRCGFFEYRDRTRTVRQTAHVPGVRRLR